MRSRKLLVVREKAMFDLRFSRDERAANEQFGCLGGIDLAVIYAAFHHLQPVDEHALPCEHARRRHVPVGIGVAELAEVRAQLHDPFGLDARHIAGEKL